MRKSFALGLLVALCGVGNPSAKAGVYNFAEPKDGLGKDFLTFRSTVIALRDIGKVAQFRRTDPLRVVPDRIRYEQPLLQRYLLVASLASAGKIDRLTVEQKLNLSAYLLRCRRETEARDLLEPVVRANTDNFLLLANLATAYFYLNELERAAFYQQQALEAWPVRYDELKPAQKHFLDGGAWSQGDHQLYRPIEEYFLILIRERQAEERRGQKDYDSLDALFVDKEKNAFRPLNEKGDYEPGKLAAAEKAKLPTNAMVTVQQLLLWLPDDNRLFWFYGELLAAKGDIEAAKNVFFKDLEKLVHAKEFREHRTILYRTPIPPPPALADAKPAPPTVEEMKKMLDALQSQTPPPYPTKHIILAFVLGIGVGLFGVWQFRELRRRHQRRPS